MSETELAHRFIGSPSRIPSDKLRKGKVARKDWPKVVKACNQLESAPLWIDDSSDLGLLELRAKARRLQAQEKGRGSEGLGMVIVDYMQLMRSDDARANRVEQVSQFSRGLKILARELARPGDRHLPALPRSGAAPRTSGRSSRTCASPAASSRTRTSSASSTATTTTTQDAETRRGRADHRQAPQRPRRAPSARVFLEHYPKFADRAREDEPAIEQPAGEGPPLEDIADDDFAEEG